MPPWLRIPWLIGSVSGIRDWFLSEQGTGSNASQLHHSMPVALAACAALLPGMYRGKHLSKKRLASSSYRPTPAIASHAPIAARARHPLPHMGPPQSSISFSLPRGLPSFVHLEPDFHKAGTSEFRTRTAMRGHPTINYDMYYKGRPLGTKIIFSSTATDWMQDYSSSFSISQLHVHVLSSSNSILGPPPLGLFLSLPLLPGLVVRVIGWKLQVE